VPLTHIFGPGTLTGFRVWAEQAPQVSLGRTFMSPVSNASTGKIVVGDLACILPALSGAPSTLNKFRRLGFVDYNGGGLEVHSSLLNVVLHN
jgi:hypothetical protein